MAKSNEPYVSVVVESYKPSSTSGLHGSVHIRPVPGQGYSSQIKVECSKALSSSRYPVGTKFRLQAKLTDREGKGDYLFSHHSWPFEIVE